MPKRPSSPQLAFDFDPPTSRDVPPGAANDGLTVLPLIPRVEPFLATARPPTTDELRRDYREQILRDLATLRMPPDFHSPSRQFYEERIQMYTESLQQLNSA